MSNNKIIKALEYWRQFDKEIDMLLEAYSGSGENQTIAMLHDQKKVTGVTLDALHLVTCQQAQIEDLSEALEERIQTIKRLEGDNRKLAAAGGIYFCARGRSKLDPMIIKLMDVRNAAIREFAERLKEESEVYCSAPNGAGETVLAVSCDDIDAIVKEMTESDDNGSE